MLVPCDLSTAAKAQVALMVGYGMAQVLPVAVALGQDRVLGLRLRGWAGCLEGSAPGFIESKLALNSVGTEFKVRPGSSGGAGQQRVAVLHFFASFLQGIYEHTCPAHQGGVCGVAALLSCYHPFFDASLCFAVLVYGDAEPP